MRVKLARYSIRAINGFMYHQRNYITTLRVRVHRDDEIITEAVASKFNLLYVYIDNIFNEYLITSGQVKLRCKSM